MYEKILSKHNRKNKVFPTLNEFHTSLDAMREYGQIKGIEKAIEENQSFLAMANAHMDERACMVIRDRISELNKELDSFIQSANDTEDYIAVTKNVVQLSEDWSKEVNGYINVPDHLDPLINKVATQIRFHTISGKDETRTVCAIVRIAEEFFEKQQANG